MASPRRDHLIQTANDLFYRDGIHATGIDRIIAEAGVAKMTLYNHFRSKDELVLAVLRRRDEEFRNWFMREIDRRGSSPREKLAAVFDVLETWFEKKDFRGCMFINTGAECGGGDTTLRMAAWEHKRLLATYLEGLARDAGASDPAGLGMELAMLMDGATVAAQLSGSAEAAQAAKHAAATLLSAALDR